MKAPRVGKQQLAFWRAAEKHAEKAANNPLLVVPENTAHHFDVERRRSYAAGWVDGVNYMKRNRKKQ
jgi:hypothetical protein